MKTANSVIIKSVSGYLLGFNLITLIIASGLISALESYQINFTLEGNVFENNYAILSGSAFSAQTMQDSLNTLTLLNNKFKNNWSSNNGGVFAFSNSWYSVYGVNNTYTNNSALGNGGVGYVFSAKLSYWEYQSLYESNYAGKLGGAWYFSTSYQWGSTQPIQFIDTTFSRSSAAQSNRIIEFILIMNRWRSIIRCLEQFNRSRLSVLCKPYFFALQSNLQNRKVEQGHQEEIFIY